KGFAAPTATVVGADGMEIDYTGKDDKIMLTIGVADAIITMGNGIQGVADLTVPAGQSVVLESGAFKNVTGAHKGTVYIRGGATTTVTAIELP
ncbi:MAG: hypothetical protein RR573_10740, partial [Oscillospiraceae bacterium]